MQPEIVVRHLVHTPAFVRLYVEFVTDFEQCRHERSYVLLGDFRRVKGEFFQIDRGPCPAGLQILLQRLSKRRLDELAVVSPTDQFGDTLLGQQLVAECEPEVGGEMFGRTDETLTTPPAFRG